MRDYANRERLSSFIAKRKPIRPLPPGQPAPQPYWVSQERTAVRNRVASWLASLRRSCKGITRGCLLRQCFSRQRPTPPGVREEAVVACSQPRQAKDRTAEGVHRGAVVAKTPPDSGKRTIIGGRKAQIGPFSGMRDATRKTLRQNPRSENCATEARLPAESPTTDYRRFARIRPLFSNKGIRQCRGGKQFIPIWIRDARRENANTERTEDIKRKSAHQGHTSRAGMQQGALHRAGLDCAARGHAAPGQNAPRDDQHLYGSAENTNRGKVAPPSQQPNEKGPPPECKGRAPEAPAKGCGISDRQWLPLPAGEGEYPTGGLSDGSNASPDVACCSATRVVRRTLRTACHLLQRRIALGDDPPQQRHSAEASRPVPC